MALVLADRVKETTDTTGTGTYSLSGGLAGFQTFNSAIGNGNTTYYTCTDGNNFEIGIGTYTSSGNTLARTTILKSSNSNSAVNWGVSTKDIFVTYPADKSVFKDASDNISGLGTASALDTGISNNNVPKFTSGVADDDFLRVSGTTIEGRSASEVLSDIGAITADSTTTLTNKTIDASQLSGNVANARLDAQLQDVAGLAVTDSGFIVGDGSNFVLETGATVRTSLGLGTVATLDTGISNTNIPKFTSGVADDDFLRVDGTSIEGRSASQVLSDIGGQASLTFGISDTNAVKIDSASVADDEYARFTANGLESRSTSEVLSDIGGQASLTFGKSDTNALKLEEAVTTNDILLAGSSNVKGRTYAELKSDLSLNNVENTALSSWVGTSNITTLGTIGTGTWQGSAVADSYISSASTWNAKQAALTFGIANTNAVKIDDADAADDDYAKLTATGIEGRSYAEVKTDLSLDNVENTALSTGTALNATHVLVTDNESTDEENLITFVEGATTATGNVGLEMDGNLTYNPSSGNLTATQLTGTLQTAAQTNITSLGTLTTLTVDNVIVNGTTIGHTDDTDLITLADGVATVTGDLTLTSTADGGPVLNLISNDHSDATDFHTEATIKFLADNSADEETEYANIQLKTADVTDGTEDGWIYFATMANGTLNNTLAFSGTGSFYLLSTNDDDPVIEWNQTGGTSYDVQLKTATPTADRTITLPDATGTVSLLTATQTLTNKTLTSPVINGFSGTGDGALTGDLTLTSTGGGATDDPSLILYRNSSSPADYDDLGEIIFRGRNDNSQDVDYARIWVEPFDVSDGTEGARLRFDNILYGSETNIFATGWGFLYLNHHLYFNASKYIMFEGATDDGNETILTVADPTADRTITLPDATGTVITTGNMNSITDIGIQQYTIQLGAGADLQFEGATANDYETTLTVTDPTADRTITLPNATGTVALKSEYFQAYISSNSSTLTDSFVIIDFDTVTLNSDASILAESGGEVTINKTGIFRFHVDVTVKTTSGSNRSDAEIEIQKQPSGGAYSSVTGTTAVTYNRTNNLGDQTASIDFLISVTSGDTYKVMVKRQGGSGTLVVQGNAARFNIQEVN